MSLSIAIFAHKIFEAFALGACCRKANVSFKNCLVGISVFAFVAPVCMYIAVFAREAVEGRAKLWLEMIFQGCAAGTFIHIAVLEVIAEEFEDPKDKQFKLLALLIGGFAMGGIAYAV